VCRVSVLREARRRREQQLRADLAGRHRFHIGIGFDKNVAASVLSPSKETAADKLAVKETAVVVEMTPQYRGDLAPEWTIEVLKQVLGKQVRVVGQLMADNEHNVPKDNCGLAGTKPRAGARPFGNCTL